MLYVFLLILLSSSYSKKTYEKKCAKPECGCYSPYLSSECTDENHWLIHATIPSCSYNPNVCTNACGGIWCDGASPTYAPTTIPTTEPTPDPTAEPTSVPTVNPNAGPTSIPTSKPTSGPPSIPN